MDPKLFVGTTTGRLVPISGVDHAHRRWDHVAFLPDPLPEVTPNLGSRTFNAVARARASLAALDTRASQLPNPALLRQPTLRIEAQSTSALEGTYAPLETVLGADDDEPAAGSALREVLNYVNMANDAFSWVADGRPVTLSFLEDAQGQLVRSTAADTDQAGHVRTIQVVIGHRRGAPVTEARFIPLPPGPELTTLVRDLLDWSQRDHSAEIDPVVAAAMAHYQFETLHPFNDGNGRIGRMIIVLQLLLAGTLKEPTLTVSPWFEARRPEYYDRLLAVSTDGDWDGWINFFAEGVAASAARTDAQLQDLVSAQAQLKQRARSHNLRADTAMLLIDFAVSRVAFTVRQAERHLNLSYARANKLVAQLIDADVLRQVNDSTYGRRFGAPAVREVLLRAWNT